MKKLLAILLTAALALSLAACGSGAANDSSTASASASASSVSQTSSETETASASETSSASEETAASSAVSETSQTSETSQALSTPEPEKEEIPIVEEDLEPGECVTIGNYKGLEVTDTYADPTEEDIDTYITSLLVPVAVEDENAVVAEGDTANIDYVGKIDGEAFDGGTSAGYDLVIGSGTFIPGFEDGVIGMKKGEVKDIDVTFPEDYGNADYAGKAAVFTVTLNEIKQAPELTDEWVKENAGVEGVETIADYKVYLKNYFQKRLRIQANSSMELELWNQVMENSKVNKIPRSFYDKAADNFDKLNASDAEYYGMTLDEFLEANGITEDYYAQLKDAYAKESAENTILSYAVWDAEKLTEESEEYTKALEELSDSVGVSYEELLEQYGEETVHNYGKTYAVLARILSYSTILPPEETAEETAEDAAENN